MHFAERVTKASREIRAVSESHRCACAYGEYQTRDGTIHSCTSRISWILERRGGRDREVEEQARSRRWQ